MSHNENRELFHSGSTQEETTEFLGMASTNGTQFYSSEKTDFPTYIAGGSDTTFNELPDFLSISMDADSSSTFNDCVPFDTNPTQVKRRGPKKKPFTKERQTRLITRRVRANARERSRMHGLNDALESLRQHMPTFSATQRLSKIETLRLAKNYIRVLSDLLNVDESPTPLEFAHKLTEGLSQTTSNLVANALQVCPQALFHLPQSKCVHNIHEKPEPSLPSTDPHTSHTLIDGSDKLDKQNQQSRNLHPMQSTEVDRMVQTNCLHRWSYDYLSDSYSSGPNICSTHISPSTFTTFSSDLRPTPINLSFDNVDVDPQRSISRFGMENNHYPSSIHS